MHTDNEFRRFRFIESDNPASFLSTIAGLMEAVNAVAPCVEVAMLEEMTIACLPDGGKLREVSYKTKHTAFDQMLPAWARDAGRRIGRIVDEEFVVSDGTTLPLKAVKFQVVETP
jgi:hypothetical protein